MVPVGSKDESELKIVRTAYNGGDHDIPRADSGKAQDTMNQWNIVTSGHLKESSRSTYTIAAGAGQAVYVERRIASDDKNVGTYGLLQGWPDALKTAAQIEMAALLNTNVVTSKDEAFKRVVAKPMYSKLCAAYRLSDNPNIFNPMAGTGEDAKYPVAAVSRPLLPHLLTSFLEGTAATYDQKLNSFAEVRVEYKTGNIWRLAEEADGFSQMDADGTCWLRGARSLGVTHSVTTSGTSPNIVVTVTPRLLRMTVAIPADHRLDAVRSLSTDPTVIGSNVTTEAGDEDRISQDLSRLYFADTRQLYQRWLRIDSYPTPESVGGTAATEQIGANPLRDDSKYLDAHLDKRLREIGRLKRSGRLVIPRLAPSYSVGEQVRNLDCSSGAFPVRGAIVGVRYVCEHDEVMTELIIS
jgi:hypothetical protein